MSEMRKPVRDRDTILVRLPDGVKERIAQRARANGRSAGAEASAMLEELLNDNSITRFTKLTEEVARLNRQYLSLKAILGEVDDLRNAIFSEIVTIVSGNSVGDIPDEVKRESREILDKFYKLEILSANEAQETINRARKFQNLYEMLYGATADRDDAEAPSKKQSRTFKLPKKRKLDLREE